VSRKSEKLNMTAENWKPECPYNAIPPLPPASEVETRAVLRQCITARAALAELKQAAELIPNQAMLINTLPLLEARASSEIENIVTTTDELFRHVGNEAQANPAVKEALRYSRSLFEGFRALKQTPLNTRTAEQVCATIKGVEMTTNADKVHGYNSPDAGLGGAEVMFQNRDAAILNNANRSKKDNNWDLTALARYTANTSYDIDFGFARKVRSPNLYERYTWSTWTMAAVMNNTVGDGNGYLGDVNLKPEKAHTLSATFDWHAADRGWEFKATPYYTRVTDYIDAIQWNGTTPAASNTATSSTYSNTLTRLPGSMASTYPAICLWQKPAGANSV
jgi:hypothetical protein